MNSSQATATSSEQYLSLYLGLMISIFCIVLLADGAQELYPIAKQQVSFVGEEAGSTPQNILEIPFTLFATESGAIDESAFENVLAILNSHDLRAELQIFSTVENAEERFGQALSLQYRFDREGLRPTDVLVEVVMDDYGQEDSKLILYPDTRPRW